MVHIDRAADDRWTVLLQGPAVQVWFTSLRAARWIFRADSALCADYRERGAVYLDRFACDNLKVETADGVFLHLALPDPVWQALWDAFNTIAHTPSPWASTGSAA